MTQEELDKIIERHQHWLKEDCKGWEDMRADLSGADLIGADLRWANLSSANLREANLRGADLRWANLREANLRCVDLRWSNLNEANLTDADLSETDLNNADLREANLHGADLRWSNLRGANLRGANLRWSNLNEANLNDADLSEANLHKAYLSEANKFRLGKILTEPLTGYKKTKEGVVITAEIPAGAIVFCINGGKCRTNKAKITDMGGHELLHSDYDNSFEYRLGQEIEIKHFNIMYNVECASGFHFFSTRKEAEEYK